MFGVNDTCNLHFATVAKQVGKGLDEQLENFVREHPETKLIIVDTLQKIREAAGDGYAYARLERAQAIAGPMCKLLS